MRKGTKLGGAVRSLTIWFNVLLGIAAGIIPVIQEVLPQIKDMMPDNVYKALFAVGIVGNAVLRARTNTALEHK